MTIYTPICTVITGPNGERCGKRPVAGFVSSSGTPYGECAEHVLPSRVSEAAAVK
jgi:hypothetical protein